MQPSCILNLDGVPSPKGRILIIDDEQDARMIMGDCLEDAGYRILEAADGREGLDLFDREKPDAVLTDIRMPVMDGLKVVETLHKTSPLTPALVISGTGAMDNVINALRLGAWDYILKPVRDSEFLSHTLHKALERAAHLRLEKNYQKQLEQEINEKTAALKAEIAAREMIQQQLEHDVCHDPLTGIGNRSLCLRDIRESTSFATVHRQAGFLLFDINALKDINDAYGYAFGDQLLLALGRRLANFFTNNGTFYRMDGDEFAVLMHAENSHEVLALARALARWISLPYTIKNHSINAGFCFGLTLFSHDCGNDGQKALNQATFAHQQAKKHHAHDIIIYDDVLHRRHRRRLALEKEMHPALSKDEFFLVYQPIVNHKSGKIFGFEGLLRWQSEKFGNVSPNEFIPVAEESGLIIELGEYALENACRFWAQEGLCGKGLALVMNVSGKQFFQQDLVARFQDIMAAARFEPSGFCLEITETALMSNVAETIHKLTCFKEMGMRISIDDFGTGYSSLEYLHKFPVDILKVDMSFVQKIDRDAKTHELVQVMRNMASIFGLKLIAEGVETTAQRELLCALGCHLHQGFLYSRPLPGEKVRDTQRDFELLK